MHKRNGQTDNLTRSDYCKEAYFGEESQHWKGRGKQNIPGRKDYTDSAGLVVF